MLGNGLKRCGLPSYRSYLLSDSWRATRERYRASKLPQGCWVCHVPNVDLHHRTYARLGNEKVTDLVPLCREHHDLLHEEGLDLWDGPSILCRREKEARKCRPRFAPVSLRRNCDEVLILMTSTSYSRRWWQTKDLRDSYIRPEQSHLCRDFALVVRPDLLVSLYTLLSSKPGRNVCYKHRSQATLMPWPSVEAIQSKRDATKDYGETKGINMANKNSNYIGRVSDGRWPRCGTRGGGILGRGVTPKRRSREHVEVVRQALRRQSRGQPIRS